MSMKENLERLAKATSDLAKGEEPDGPTEMSPEDFIAYAAEQMEKAAGDSPEVREARLTALGEVVADVEKNFEGMNETLGGLLAVKQFRDPGQVQTTMKTTNPTTPPVGAGNFASNAEAPGVNGAGSAPTGKLVPAPQKSAESFMKAMADLTAVLKGETSESAAPEGEKAPENAEGGETDPKPVEKSEGSQGDREGKEGEPAFVAKATGVVWPLDMNTPFGRGETDDDEVPEWGRDGDQATGETTD